MGLPKWPALAVVGKKLTDEQAAEVLIRTDGYVPNFKYAGNDKHHAKRLNALFGFYGAPGMDATVEERRAYWDKTDDLRNRLRVVRLEYLANHQIVSSWVGGPHGWVNWNGDVFCNTFNIGKWPDIQTVAEEWGRIAEAFPYLDLRSQLFDGETSEDGNPVVEFVVSEGVVVVTEPRGVLVPTVLMPLNPAIQFGSSAREHGISVDELREKLHGVYGEEVPQL